MWLETSEVSYHRNFPIAIHVRMLTFMVSAWNAGPFLYWINGMTDASEVIYPISTIHLSAVRETSCHHSDVIWARWYLKYRRLECLLSRCLFRRRSKKISKLRITGLCEGNPPVTDGFPSQRASNAEMFPFVNVIILSELTHEVTIMTSLSCTVSVADSCSRDTRHVTAAPDQMTVTPRRFCRLSDIYSYLRVYIWPLGIVTLLGTLVSKGPAWQEIMNVFILKVENNEDIQMLFPIREGNCKLLISRIKSATIMLHRLEYFSMIRLFLYALTHWGRDYKGLLFCKWYSRMHVHVWGLLF